MKAITMHGPALDGSGVMKELEVDPLNVAAFKASGYVEGGLPIPDDEKRADGTPCETYTEADVAEQMPTAKKKGK